MMNIKVFYKLIPSFLVAIARHAQSTQNNEIAKKKVRDEVEMKLIVQISIKIFYKLTIMMMNCFCGMVDRRKAFSLIFSWDHCQRSSPSRISDTPQAMVWTYREEPEFRLIWMKLHSSDNHYTTAPHYHF